MVLLFQPWVISILVAASVSGQTTEEPCEDGWADYNGNCYLIVEDKKASQSDALQDCNSRHSDLLILEIPEELEWILQETTSIISDGYWTKMTRQLDTNRLQWDVDFPPDPTVVSWNLEPDNANGNENCGAINEQAAFSDEDCQRKLGFLCSVKSDGCPFDWLIGNGECFYISDTFNSTQLMTWEQATGKCASMFAGAQLADMSDYDAQDYLSSVLPEQTQTTLPWWTSLNRKNNQWYWGTTLAQNSDDLNWVQEPNNLNGAENCVMLYSNGKMADKDCARLANYICRKADHAIPRAYEKAFGCGPWVRAGEKCYYFENNFPETFDTAQDICRLKGADLLKIETMDEKNYIDFMTRYNNRMYWTQLTAPSSSGVWTFADGSRPSPDALVWNEEPNDYSGVQDCVGIRVKQTWDDASCAMNAGYICEAQSSGQGCPGNWTSYKDSCYFFGPLTADSGRLSWWMARRVCRNSAAPLAGRLLSVDDPDELNFVNTQLTARQSLGLFYWTGLNDVAAEGTLVYDSVDVLPRLDIIPWDISPSCTSCSPDCSVLVVGGSTADVECTSKHSIICEKYAIGASPSLHKAYKRTSSAVFASALIISILPLSL